MSTIRYGQNLKLTNGESVVLLSAINGRAFVQFSRLVDIEVKPKDGPPVPVGQSYKAWVPAPGWEVLKDRDGVAVGVHYAGAA